LRFVIVALLVSFLSCFVKAENTHSPLQIAILIQNSSSWEDIPFHEYLAKLPQIAGQAFANDPYDSLTWRTWLPQRRQLPGAPVSCGETADCNPSSPGTVRNTALRKPQ
jgi:hypothetical protein